jgi:hypothetical protein
MRVRQKWRRTDCHNSSHRVCIKSVYLMSAAALFFCCNRAHKAHGKSEHYNFEIVTRRQRAERAKRPPFFFERFCVFIPYFGVGEISVEFFSIMKAAQCGRQARTKVKFLIISNCMKFFDMPTTTKEHLRAFCVRERESESYAPFILCFFSLSECTTNT